MPTVQTIRSGKVQTIIRSIHEQRCREGRHRFVPTLELDPNNPGQWIPTGDFVCAFGRHGCDARALRIQDHLVYPTRAESRDRGEYFIQSPDPELWEHRWCDSVEDAREIIGERMKGVKGVAA